MKRIPTILLSLLLLLTACTPAPETDTQATILAVASTKAAETFAAMPTSTSTDIPPTATPIPTDTPVPTDTPIPTDTLVPTAAATPTSTPVVIPDDPLLTYYVNVEDGEPVGCGTDMIPVRTTYARTGDPVFDVSHALTVLLSNHSPYVIGLYNAYAPWVFQVEEVVYDQAADHLNVYLRGDYNRNTQSRCENRRVHAQIAWTVKFNTTASFDIWINGQTIKDVLIGD